MITYLFFAAYIITTIAAIVNTIIIRCSYHKKGTNSKVLPRIAVIGLFVAALLPIINLMVAIWLAFGAIVFEDWEQNDNRFTDFFFKN